jgi:hypothetical protein
MCGEKIETQHLESVFVQLDIVLRKMFAKEAPHQVTSFYAGVRSAVIESLRMLLLQQIV